MREISRIELICVSFCMAMISDPVLQNEWIDGIFRKKNSSMRLFCFPYAGGSSQAYYGWNQHLPGALELCPIQLPGRGARFQAPPYRQFERLIPSLAAGLAPMLDKPFVFFGHSMGGIIAYELAQYLNFKEGILPEHLYVSGCRAPHIPRNVPPIFDLSDDDFVKELGKFNGTPKDVLENKSLLELFLPVLRADFELIETYRHTRKVQLNCPITALGGLSDDAISQSDVKAWSMHSSSNDFRAHFLPGDHFFMKHSENLVLEIALRRLYAQCAAKLQVAV